MTSMSDPPAQSRPAPSHPADSLPADSLPAASLPADSPPAHSPPDHSLIVERIGELNDDDMEALCEAADAAILEGGGFGWVRSPGRLVLTRYFRGVVLVPERELFVARLDGVIVGSAQLVRPPRNNEAQAFSATLMHAFIAPYARGHGLARLLTIRVEDGARALGYQVLNLDVRESQEAAIRLYERLGYERWGIHPCYARVAGTTIRGFYYHKMLQHEPKA